MRVPDRVRGVAMWSGAAALVALTAVTFVAGLPLWISFWTDNQPLDAALGAAGLAHVPLPVLLVVVGLTATAVHAITAGLIVWRRRDAFALGIAVATFIYGCVHVGVLNVVRANDPAWTEQARVVATLNRVGVIYVLLTFPNGRFVPKWTRGLLLVLIIWSLAAIPFPDLGPLRQWDLAVAASLFAGTVGVFAQVYRYRRVATVVERQQLKWLTAAFIFVLASWAALGPALVVAAPDPAALFRLPPSLELAAGTYVVLIIATLFYYATTIVPPIAIAFAILRRGLFDIDLIANRAVTYAAATAIVGAGVMALGLAVQQVITEISSDTFAGSPAIVGGLAAVVTFVPVRRRLQPIVDRLLPDRPVVTVLFTDLVGSTELALQQGDQQWSRTLERYHGIVRQALRRNGGAEIDTAGDGVFAIFGRADPAIRCADVLTEAVRALGARTRVGIHTGPCTMRGGMVVGVTVHVGARLVALARADEVLVSDATRAAVTDAALVLRNEGERELKGLPGTWRVHSLVRTR